MSWGVIIAAVLDAELPTSEKMTLLAIARHADDQGRCWPSVARIEKLSGLKRSTVFQCMNELEKKGALSREERKGKSTLYTVKVQDMDPSIKRTRPANGPLPVHLMDPTRPANGPLPVHLMDPTRPANGPLPVHLMDPEEINRRDQGRSSSEEPKGETTELHPSTGEIVRALGIVSPGYIAEAEEEIDVWLKLGVPFTALVEAATKSRGKKNPVAYMRSVVKPELETIAKRKQVEAERKAKAKAGPDWDLIFRIYANEGRWPLYDHGPEPHKPGPHMFPQEHAEKYAAVIEHKRKIYEATRRQVDALEL